MDTELLGQEVIQLLSEFGLDLVSESVKVAVVNTEENLANAKILFGNKPDLLILVGNSVIVIAHKLFVEEGIY